MTYNLIDRSNARADIVPAINLFEQRAGAITIAFAKDGIIELESEMEDGRKLLSRVVSVEDAQLAERLESTISALSGVIVVAGTADLCHRAGLIDENYFYFAPFLIVGVAIFLSAEFVSGVMRRISRKIS